MKGKVDCILNVWQIKKDINWAMAAFLSGYQAERNNLLGILEEREESL